MHLQQHHSVRSSQGDHCGIGERSSGNCTFTHFNGYLIGYISSSKDHIMMKGTCLCGAVSFEIEGTLEHPPEACHCSQCRKQTGHFLVAVNVRRKALKVHGADKVTWFRSSEQVQRGFCSVCGSTLFWNPTIEGYGCIGKIGRAHVCTTV